MKSGVLGKNIAYSLSPLLFKILGEQAGIDVQYDIFDKDFTDSKDIVEFLLELEGKGYCGINVTIPYKKLGAHASNYLVDMAKPLEAVNTINIQNGSFTGFNTDYSAIRDLIGEIPIQDDSKILLIGAGGAAAAYAFGLTELENVNLYIQNRSKSRAVLLQQKLKLLGRTAQIIDIDEIDEHHFQGIVNATPIGRENDELPVLEKTLQRSEFVIDAVYKIGNTTLINKARQLNIKCFDGFKLLFLQGIKSFEIMSQLKLPYKEQSYSKFIEAIEKSF